MRTALLLAPLLLLPACGGDEPDRKAEYVAEAERVCAEANRERSALTQPTSVAAVPVYVREVLAVARDSTTRLAALEPPPEDADEVQEEFVGPLQDQLREGEAFARQVDQAAAAKDTPRLLALLGEAPTETQADLEFLRDYGFEACVEAADTGRAAG